LDALRGIAGAVAQLCTIELKQVAATRICHAGKVVARFVFLLPIGNQIWFCHWRWFTEIVGSIAMTNPSDNTDIRPRRSTAPWLVGALIAIIVVGSLVWVNHNADTKSAAPAPQPQASAQPSQDQAEATKQTLSSLQQTVQEVQANQQRLADQIKDIQQQASQFNQQKFADQMNDLQQKVAAQQGEQKTLSDKLSALSARVDDLVSTNAESPATSLPPKNKRGKR